MHNHWKECANSVPCPSSNQPRYPPSFRVSPPQRNMFTIGPVQAASSQMPHLMKMSLFIENQMPHLIESQMPLVMEVPHLIESQMPLVVEVTHLIESQMPLLIENHRRTCPRCVPLAQSNQTKNHISFQMTLFFGTIFFAVCSLPAATVNPKPPSLENILLGKFARFVCSMSCSVLP